ncbi:unnamed protein product, partial [Brassica oleracea]
QRLVHERTCLLSPKPPSLSSLPSMILFLFHFKTNTSRAVEVSLSTKDKTSDKNIAEKKMYQDQRHAVGCFSSSVLPNIV